MISAKKEFEELRPTNDNVKIGKFFKHQVLIKLYMKIYDNLCIMDEPGTGKTCAIIAFAEYVQLPSVNTD
jgi:hypothetical protein